LTCHHIVRDKTWHIPGLSDAGAGAAAPSVVLGSFAGAGAACSSLSPTIQLYTSVEHGWRRGSIPAPSIKSPFKFVECAGPLLSTVLDTAGTQTHLLLHAHAHLPADAATKLLLLLFLFSDKGTTADEVAAMCSRRPAAMHASLDDPLRMCNHPLMIRCASRLRCVTS
jgi:hypothetical protein